MNVSVVRLRIKKEFIAAFESEMKRHIGWTRAHEPGCISFEVAADTREVGTYHLFEIFRDARAGEEHGKSPSLAMLVEKLGEWLLERVQHDATRLQP